MDFFKDVITDIVETMPFVQKKKNKCPACGNGKLKKESMIDHYAKVCATKMASAMIGGSVPSPDYWFVCSNCKEAFFLENGKFVSVNYVKRVIDIKGASGGAKKRENNTQALPQNAGNTSAEPQEQVNEPNEGEEENI